MFSNCKPLVVILQNSRSLNQLCHYINSDSLFNRLTCFSDFFSLIGDIGLPIPNLILLEDEGGSLDKANPGILTLGLERCFCLGASGSGSLGLFTFSFNLRMVERPTSFLSNVIYTSINVYAYQRLVC